VHWIDIVLLLMIGGLTFAGYKRGVVVEVFDWITLIVAFSITLRIYRPIATGLRGAILKGWSQDATQGLVFWFFLIPLGLIAFTVGLHLDRVTRENERIPEQIRNVGGAIVGFLKSLALGCLLVAWIPTTSMLADTEKQEFHDAAGAATMRGLNGPISGLVRLAAPKDMADRFIKQMHG
jgi:uncharacterized membrane protein required for colicin V production